MGNVEVAWEDVISVINLVRPQIIGIVALLLAMIVVIVVAAIKLKKPTKGFVQLQSVICFVAIAAIVVNMMLTGPLYNTLSVVLSEAGELTQESVDNSRRVVEEVTNEGIILARNEGGYLPIAAQNVNVFGWASTNPIYGGTGSGTVDPSTAVSILQGLQNAGFQVNTELSDMYTAFREDRPVISINNGQDWSLPEPTADSYTQELLDNAKAFSDTAVIVIARSGGEGADLPHDMGQVLDGTWNQELSNGRGAIEHGSYWKGNKYTNAFYTPNSSEYADFEYGQSYLELSRTERDLVDLVTSNFNDVIVIYNGANPLEMGWVNEYPQIKGLLLCAGAGATGFNALGNIISGQVNPSGRTVDTWVYDLTATPYYNNIGHFNYTDATSLAIAERAQQAWERADGFVTFVNYVENIYTGYRFYETAYVDAMEGFDYDATVQYPFGYGLSYTSFEQKMGSLNVSGNAVTVDVTVTNTGSVAGKDVVELYYTPPYTNGGVEKAAVNLVAFDKTALLEPGASETLTLNFELEDMASYDAHGRGTWVLEKGDYEISLRADAHTVIDSQTYSVTADVVYDASNPHNEDVQPANNKFDFAEGSVNYLSRRDAFANYEQAVAAPSDFTLTTTLYANGSYDPAEHNDASDTMPTTGAKNGMQLLELRGADYDDPRWETLLDQVTVAEMVDLIAYGGHQTASVNSVGKLRTMDTDGPAGVNSSTLGFFGTGFCSEILIAQTWNEDLAYAASEAMAKEFRDFGVVGWYAPSMNMHRSAFGGRNFEYYSEDSLLSARMGVQETAACVENGMYPYIKHFALNEQETNRNGMLCTWLTEQSMRELYLRPFEECVKYAPSGKIAIMSSYNYIGSQWAGACRALQTEVLRGEWGFEGFVLSDYFGNYGYMDADRAIRGGTDVMLGTAGNEAILTDQTSATSIKAMRQATKNVFFTTVNSEAFADMASGVTPGWLRTTHIIDGVLAAVLIICEILLIRGFLKKRKRA